MTLLLLNSQLLEANYSENIQHTTLIPSGRGGGGLDCEQSFTLARCFSEPRETRARMEGRRKGGFFLSDREQLPWCCNPGNHTDSLQEFDCNRHPDALSSKKREKHDVILGSSEQSCFSSSTTSY